MPSLAEMFPSQYLSGEDLGGKAFTLVMRRVVVEEIFDVKKNKKAKKWVLYFDGAKKGCLIGKTQADSIFEATNTTRTEEWSGKKIEVYATTIKAFGEDHVVARFRSATKINEAPPPDSMQTVIEEEDDEEPIEEEVTATQHPNINAGVSDELFGTEQTQEVLEDQLNQIRFDLERTGDIGVANKALKDWKNYSNPSILKMSKSAQAHLGQLYLDIVKSTK